MKTKLHLLLITLAAISTRVLAIPHIDPQMTGNEYRSIFARRHDNQPFKKHIEQSPLHDILELGKRNLD